MLKGIKSIFTKKFGKYINNINILKNVHKYEFTSYLNKEKFSINKYNSDEDFQDSNDSQNSKIHNQERTSNTSTTNPNLDTNKFFRKRIENQNFMKINTYDEEERRSLGRNNRSSSYERERFSSFERNHSDSFINAPNNSEVQKIQIPEYNDSHINISPEEQKKFYDENQIIVNSKVSEPLPKMIKDLQDTTFDQKLKNYLMQQFQSPTPIQSLTWPIAQKGFNLVGVAETGSGKTLSFVLPAIQHIISQRPKRHSREGPIALVCAPTRELAMQIHKVANEYSNIIGFRTACLYGGTPRGVQIREVIRGVELVVATPGRLLDLVSSGKTSLRRASFVVLDEADRMLDMGFEKDLREILSQTHPEAQTLMWSATWPKEIVSLAEEFLKNYVHIKIGKSENGLSINKRIKQNFIFCSKYDKNAHLDNLIDELKSSNEEAKNEMPKSILFTNQKMKCDSLVNHLRKHNITCETLNGDLSQNERDYSINKFKRNDVRVLVATDVAARGLDINDVKIVINYDFPNNIEDYVHRIGRTGRSGRTGISYALMTSENVGIYRNLRNLLIKAEQEIPRELEVADRGGSSRGRGGFRGRGRSGGYGNRESYGRRDSYDSRERTKNYNY